MQTYAGFIQDVYHVDETGAYLRRKTYALAFPARKRRGRPVQAQIVQAHVKQEMHPVMKLAYDVARYGVLPGVQPGRQAVNPYGELRNLHGAHLRDVLSVYAEAAGVLVQPRAVAHGADDLVLNVPDHSGPVDHFGKRALTHAEELVGAVYHQSDGLIRQGGYRLI